jgi:transposase
MGVAHGHWKSTTFVAGLRTRGLVAPLVLDGPINGEAFEADVAQVLVPTLNEGDIVVTENLSPHKGAVVRAAIEGVGGEMRYLPPSIPNFNPIEMAFSQLKALLRKASERTQECLWAAIGAVLPIVTPGHATNYFTAAGYEPS